MWIFSLSFNGKVLQRYVRGEWVDVMNLVFLEASGGKFLLFGLHISSLLLSLEVGLELESSWRVQNLSV